MIQYIFTNKAYFFIYTNNYIYNKYFVQLKYTRLLLFLQLPQKKHFDLYEEYVD